MSFGVLSAFNNNQEPCASIKCSFESRLDWANLHFPASKVFVFAFALTVMKISVELNNNVISSLYAMSCQLEQAPMWYQYLGSIYSLMMIVCAQKVQSILFLSSFHAMNSHIRNKTPRVFYSWEASGTVSSNAVNLDDQHTGATSAECPRIVIDWLFNWWFASTIIMHSRTISSHWTFEEGIL